MADNPFEIPQTFRQVSEQNLKQLHAAYEQLAVFMTRVMDAWTDALPSNPMAAVFKDVQGRAVQIAMENVEVSVHVRRQDQQRTDPPRYCDAADAVCPRADADLRHADAGASKADRGNSPEAPTQLI